MQDMLGLISLFVFISFAAHVLACFWLLLGRRDKDDYTTVVDVDNLSWVYNPNNLFVPDPNDYKHLYVLSVFYVLETITTVGYGDYTGGNTYERVYAMFLEFVGLTFYSIMMGSINLIMRRGNAYQDLIESKLESLDLWIQRIEKSNKPLYIPPVRYQKIRGYV
jgi:hypothetical protein